MLWSFTNWRRRRLLKRHHIPDTLWKQEVLALPVFTGLNEEDLQRLRELSLLLMAEKTFEGTHELVLNDAMCLRVAALAALPILNLGLDAYCNFYSVILYPEVFTPEREHMDAAGVVHRQRQPLAGEAWQQGPVLLSWPDVEASGHRDGWNVVIHELAHKLDMLNGDAQGVPPLPAGMHVSAWERVMERAADQLEARMDAGEYSCLDPYALENEAEFFAVASEMFFELPHALAEEYPDLYEQLRGFYRQDPAARLPRVEPPPPCDCPACRGMAEQSLPPQ